MTDQERKQTYPAYHRPVPATWWMRNRRYCLFAIRESTSVFVALFVLLYLYEFFLLSKGAEAHALFRQSLGSGAFVAFYVIVLLFALYHSITWLGLVSKIQIVRLGRLTVAPRLVSAGAYLVWLVSSAAVAYGFLVLP